MPPQAGPAEGWQKARPLRSLERASYFLLKKSR
jgi:hypothetical protein